MNFQPMITRPMNLTALLENTLPRTMPNNELLKRLRIDGLNSSVPGYIFKEGGGVVEIRQRIGVPAGSGGYCEVPELAKDTPAAEEVEQLGLEL